MIRQQKKSGSEAQEDLLMRWTLGGINGALGFMKEQIAVRRCAACFHPRIGRNLTTSRAKK